MTNRDLLETELRQSAADMHCAPEDFKRDAPVIVRSGADERARKYLTLPFRCAMVSYGSNIVASVGAECEGIARDYLAKYPLIHSFEPPHMHVLHEALAEQGLGIGMTAEYWLPDLTRLEALPCAYETKVLTPDSFAELYTPEWSNALCEKRAELDVLAVGAYDGGRLIGLAGCSADCADMWQIGVDVLPEYRGRYIAPALTSTLAMEILRRGKVPFYCCAWCNLPSARNAVRSGFRPVWTEMHADTLEHIALRNRC